MNEESAAIEAKYVRSSHTLSLCLLLLLCGLALAFAGARLLLLQIHPDHRPVRLLAISKNADGAWVLVSPETLGTSSLELNQRFVRAYRLDRGIMLTTEMLKPFKRKNNQHEEYYSHRFYGGGDRYQWKQLADMLAEVVEFHNRFSSQPISDWDVQYYQLLQAKIFGGAGNRYMITGIRRGAIPLAVVDATDISLSVTLLSSGFLSLCACCWLWTRRAARRAGEHMHFPGASPDPNT